MRRWTGVILMVVSAVAFGALGVLARLAQAEGADMITVLYLRFTIAALCMGLLMAARRIPVPRGATLAGLIALGGLLYVGQSLAYFTALTLASAGLVAVLLYLYPVLVTAMAALFLKERLSATRVGALGLALAGTALTIGLGGAGQPLGIALGVLAALIYSVYIIVGSQVTARAGAIASSTVIMLAAAVVYTGLMLVRGPAFPASGAGWLAVIAIALLATVVAIVTFFAGMALIGPTDASTISALEPLVSVILATVVLDEPLGLVQIAGGAMILSAVVILARSQPPASGSPAEPAAVIHAEEPHL